jgi:hypothetical protein
MDKMFVWKTIQRSGRIYTPADRAVRSLVKIFDIEEYVLQEDLTEMMLTRPVEADGVFPDAAVHVGQAHLGVEQGEQVNASEQTAAFPVWLQHSASIDMDPLISQEWEDKCLTYEESCCLANVVSGIVKEKFGDAVEINLPATYVSDLADAEAVHDEEETEGAVEGDPLLGLIQMLRRTNLNHK